MAEGDAVVDSGSVSGGADQTVTVPSSTEWVIGCFPETHGNVAYGFDDGTNTGRITNRQGNVLSAMNSNLPFFNDSVDVFISNLQCSTQNWFFSGKEVSGNVNIDTGSVSGGSDATITVPSNTAWVAQSFGTLSGNVALGWDDGTLTERIAFRQSNNMAGMNDQRPVFTDAIDPQIQNEKCNSQSYYVANRTQ